MNIFAVFVFSLLSLFAAEPSAAAGPQVKVTRIDSSSNGWQSKEMDDIVDLPELATFLLVNDGNITVGNIVNSDMIPKENKDVDIKEGDILLMANGKRMKSLDDFKTLYKQATPGTEMKLGIKRGEAMMIASFNKMDPEKFPKRKMMIRRSTSGGDDEDMLAIPQVGIFIGAKGKKVSISEVLEDAPEKAKGDFKAGDQVTSINGKKVASFEDFSKVYTNLAVGDNVEIGTLRSDKKLTITFKKPENKGMMRVIKKN